MGSGIMYVALFYHLDMYSATFYSSAQLQLNLSNGTESSSHTLLSLYFVKMSFRFSFMD